MYICSTLWNSILSTPVEIHNVSFYFCILNFVSHTLCVPALLFSGELEISSRENKGETGKKWRERTRLYLILFYSLLYIHTYTSFASYRPNFLSHNSMFEPRTWDWRSYRMHQHHLFWRFAVTRPLNWCVALPTPHHHSHNSPYVMCYGKRTATDWCYWHLAPGRLPLILVPLHKIDDAFGTFPRLLRIYPVTRIDVTCFKAWKERADDRKILVYHIMRLSSPDE